MTLIVEDGTVVVGAESYVNVADAATYHSLRGNNTWAVLTTAQVEEALRRSTDYMLEAYRTKWQGYRFTAKQSLDWPRSYVPIPDAVSGYGPHIAMVAPNVVPMEVKYACAELALRAAAGDLLSDLSQNVISEQVGPIKVEYDRNSPQRIRYPSVDALLRPYLKMMGASTALLRA